MINRGICTIQASLFYILRFCIDDIDIGILQRYIIIKAYLFQYKCSVKLATKNKTYYNIY